jgi:hypothetical protein
MRSLALLWALSACHHTAGIDARVDPREVIACDASWVANGFTQCEAACADSSTALGAMGTACTGTITSGATESCSKTFEFSGVTGCCVSNPPEVLFAECTP